MKLKTNDYVTRRQQKKVSISYNKLKWTWWQINSTINEQKNLFFDTFVLLTLLTTFSATYAFTLPKYIS